MPLDPVSSLILDEAGPPAPTLVIDDIGGALCRALLSQGLDVLAHCDDLRDEAALPEGVQLVGPADAAGAGRVLMRLPRALSALEETAEGLAASGGPDLRLVAGGRVKHMTRGMNDVLQRRFGRVSASLGRQKSRVLHASAPRPGRRTWPRRRELPDLGLTLVAHGAAFQPAGVDAGTRLLLEHLPGEPRGRAIDLGSGTGLVATVLARAGNEVVATDVSAAAVASTAATAEANGVQIEVQRADGLTALPDASADLIATNPPFHRGAAKDTTPTAGLIGDAARVLAPGGEFWCVFNSHLPYLSWLADAVGPTRIVARDRSYTVARATRRR